MTDRAAAGEAMHGPMHLADAELDPTAGDPRHARFRALYRGQFAFVWAVARRFGVHPAALDDAVQEVFLTAFRRLDQLDYEVSPRGWLYAVTRRVASRHHRGQARQARKSAALADTARGAGERPHERHDAARLLERLLAKLPPAARAVWEMTELLGMTAPEIAGELSIPLNTVYSRLRIARARLQDMSSETYPIAACVDRARRDDAPPPAAAARSWAALVPVLGPGGGGATLAGAWASARTAMAVTLVAAGGAVATIVAPPASRTASPPPVVAVEHAPTSMSEETSHSPAAAPPVDAAPTDAPAVTEVAASAPDRLAVEVGLIDRARAHLLAREPAAALAALAAHERDFPRGSLADAREAARVEALCLQGDRDAAAAAAGSLFARRPDSALARRFERYVCAP